MSDVGIAPPFDRIDEFEAGAARQRLDAQVDLAELARAAGLLLVPGVAFGRRGDGLAIGDARRRASSTSSLNWLAMRSSTERRCRSPKPHSTVSLSDRCRGPPTSVGSSAVIRCSTSEIRCSSPRRFGSIATPCIGVGNSSGFMWMWSSSCESCSTQSNSISSTLATAAMSPGTARSTLDVLASLQHEQVADLERLAAIADVELRVAGDRALVHAEDAELARRTGPSTTLNTCASTCCFGSGVEWNSVAAAPSPLVNSGGLPSAGFGSELLEDLDQLGDARAGARRHEAHGHQMAFAQRLLERRVQLVRRRSRPARDRATSAPRRLRRPGRPARRCASATDEKSDSPDGIEKAVDDALAAAGGQVDRQAFLAERRLDRRRERLGRSTFSASILLTMTRRHSCRLAAQSIIRDVIISMPDCALTTTAAVSTASSAPIDWPMKSGKPGVSIEMDARVRCVSKCRSDERSECW